MKTTFKFFISHYISVALLTVACASLALPTQAADLARPQIAAIASSSAPESGLREGDSCGCFVASGGLIPDDVAILARPKKSAKVSSFSKDKVDVTMVRAK